MLYQNETFAVCERIQGADGRVYLLLADYRGWAFDDSALMPHDPSVVRGRWSPTDATYPSVAPLMVFDQAFMADGTEQTKRRRRRKRGGVKRNKNKRARAAAEAAALLGKNDAEFEAQEDADTDAPSEEDEDAPLEADSSSCHGSEHDVAEIPAFKEEDFPKLVSPVR